MSQAGKLENNGGSGGRSVNAIQVDAFTPPGTNPVVPNAANLLTMTGAQVAAGVVGTNVIRTDSVSANTVTIEIQRSQAVGVSTLADNGVSHFDSADFTVDANGFVSLAFVPAAFTWSDQAISFAAASFNGYFIIGNLTATLPAAPANGDTIEFFVDGAFTLVVQANAGQTIKLATSLTSVAGTMTNTASGDALTLVYRSTNTRWEATSFVGGFNAA